MNVVPELVCDILNYMCNYIHLRSNKISKDAYEAMLQGQIQKLPVSTVKQLENIESGGWKYSTEGIE